MDWVYGGGNSLVIRYFRDGFSTETAGSESLGSPSGPMDTITVNCYEFVSNWFAELCSVLEVHHLQRGNDPVLSLCWPSCNL